MPLKLTRADWNKIFPQAPSAVIDAFAANAGVLDAAGITQNRTRLAYTLANVEHECGGFTVKNLTENINYTAKGMAKTWPKRFPNGESDVIAKYGTAKGWQKKAFDDIYARKELGNRPGTDDGSRYIGRGGPQVTGRDGYAQVGQRSGLDLESNPELATLPEHQPAILAAFYTWKGLSKFADKGDFVGFVKAWNGGAIGMADRKERLAGNDPIIAKLTNVATLMPVLETLH